MLDMVVLGVVQGLTEFLPVSSTAHLIFAEAFLGISRPGILLEAILHLGTVLAAVVLFRHEVALLWRGWWSTFARGSRAEWLAGHRRLSWLIVLITAITGAIGVALEAPLLRMFSSLRGTAIQLVVTGVILFFARRRGERLATDATLRDAVGIGLAQAVAIIPGISRSGTTITSGTWLGFRSDEATKLSFLAAIPAVAAAGLFGLKDLPLGRSLGYTVPQLLVGLAVSAVFGAVAIRWLLVVVRRGRLGAFGVYCIVAGVAVFIAAGGR